MKQTLIIALFTFIAGALAMAGIRAAEWLIPEPEQRIVICMADELGDVTICRSLQDMLDKAEAKRQP